MKNNIFKKAFTLGLAAASLFTLTACGGSTEETPANDGPEKLTVAIVQPMSHSSLDQIRDTIAAELESNTSIELRFENANGDTTALNTIMQNLRNDDIDILVPIATGGAQSAKAAFEGSGVPLVFAAVSDPEAAGLTGEGSEDITGVSNNIPADQIVQLISDFQPDFQKIGFLYNSSETNSVSTIEAAKAYCDENGIAYEEASIASLTDLQTACESLIDRGVDALYTGNDNSIASAMPTYTDIAYTSGIPVYCGADSMVADGGLATIGVDYVTLGEQVAAIVERIAAGESPSDIPYETLSEYARFVNLQAAGRLGLDLSDAVMENYTVLVEADGTSHFGE